MPGHPRQPDKDSKPDESKSVNKPDQRPTEEKKEQKEPEKKAPAAKNVDDDEKFWRH